jgi:transposase
MSDNYYMDKDTYIKQLEQEIVQLKKQIKELERRLGMNSQNSSKPPSSDPPGMPTVLPRKLRRKKCGAQKGHPPYLRELLPQELVKKHIHLKPDVCTCGSTHLQDTDQEPLRHQIVDIPPIKPEAIEYVQHISQCRDCGAFVYQPLPDDIKRRHFGPGVLAMVGILTGVLNTSKRKAAAMLKEVFGVPMSLGGLSHCEAHVSDILEPPYHQAADHVRGQETAHADETSWPRGNRLKGWLWALGCSTAVFFMVQAQRSQQAARTLLGGFTGKLVSDRYNAYKFYSWIRQICWAHLKRDFKALSEANGPLGKIGGQLHELAKEILKLRKRVRDGTLRWETFQHRMPALQKRVESLLEAGARFDGNLGGKCRDILEHRQYLWTFVQDQKVEPTNNLAERIVRQAVLWRKGSFGTQSQRGARYVERILTVCATCRLQGRSVIQYLRAACHCHLNGLPVPSLIESTGSLVKSA